MQVKIESGQDSRQQVLGGTRSLVVSKPHFTPGEGWAQTGEGLCELILLPHSDIHEGELLDNSLNVSTRGELLGRNTSLRVRIKG